MVGLSLALRVCRAPPGFLGGGVVGRGARVGGPRSSTYGARDAVLRTGVVMHAVWLWTSGVAVGGWRCLVKVDAGGRGRLGFAQGWGDAGG